MKSTIKFDLTEQNESCILVGLNNSEDVRDKIAWRFFEELGGDSNWLNVTVLPSGERNTKDYLITPISNRVLTHPGGGYGLELLVEQILWRLTEDARIVGQTSREETYQKLIDTLYKFKKEFYTDFRDKGE